MNKLGGMLFWALCGLATAASASMPNILVIVADDLGLGDIGRQHTERTGAQPLAPTPALDALADDGMWFTDAHSPCALCAPSRYSFMTGNYTYRSAHPGGTWGAFWQNAITTSDMTLGRITKAAGFNTGFVGKWHLGGDFHATGSSSIYRGNDANATPAQVDMTSWVDRGPQDMGFDYDFTLSTGVQGPVYVAHENGTWYPFDDANSSLVYYDENSALDPLFVSDKGPGVGDSHWDARALNMLLADKAAAFISSNAASADPFFLYYCSPAVHLPWTPPASIDGETIAGTTPSSHTDMNRVLDLEVKRMIDALKAAGEYDNTLIIFTSDNGGLWNQTDLNAGHIANGGGVNGYKNDRREGGTLVPFIAVWPDVIAANSRSDSLINGTDILATLAALLDEPFAEDQAMDSFNMLPIFTNSVAYEPRAELLYQAGTGNELKIRQGKWKLTMSPTADFNYSNATRAGYYASHLHNLASDPKENNNLVSNPDQTARVASMFDRYWDLREAGGRTAPSSGATVVIPEPTIIYVDGASGNDLNSGTNWSDPLKTITAGIAAAGPEEEIWVAAGTYNEGGTLSLPTGTALYGGFANGQTSLDQRNVETNPTTLNGSQVVILNSSNIRLDGFTITGVSGDWTSAVKIDTSTGGPDVDEVTLANCAITGNTVGPAIILIRGWQGQSVHDVTFEQCAIHGNSSIRDYTGVLNVNPISGQLTIRNCAFYNNSVSLPLNNASGAGITFNGGDLLIENSLFYGNLSENADKSTGVQVSTAGSVKIINSTFGGAAAGTAAGNPFIRLAGGNTIILRNNIFAGSPQTAVHNTRTVQTTMADCLFHANVLGHVVGTDTAPTEGAINALSWASDCVVADPAFAPNFALTPGSPAIDAGDATALSPTATTDLKGDPRVVGLDVELGAYEIMDQDADGLPDAFEMASTTPPSPTTLAADSDEDGDGIGALAEFAFGLSATTWDAGIGAVHAFTNMPAETYLTLSYRRAQDAEEYASVTVLRSSELSPSNTWSAGETTPIATNEVDANVALITERSTHPVSSQSAEFLKLEVAPTP